MVPSGEWGKIIMAMIQKTGDSLLPLLRLKLLRVESKAAVGYHHLIYIMEDGSVWGRGSNQSGQLGQA